MIYSSGSFSQSLNSDGSERRPAVAGQFYPASETELTKMLLGFFQEVKPVSEKHALAIISPHAGYVYSGRVAATAFAALEDAAVYKTVFLIGSSHHFGFDWAALYPGQAFHTPLGRVEIDTAVCKQLASDGSHFKYSSETHSKEHSLEVQLPFLQYRLKENFKIVPILLGTFNPQSCKKIAATLSPYLTPENLFVISTDFSHYPAYTDAVKADKAAMDAICSLIPKTFLQTVEQIPSAKIKGMATVCCGWTSVLTLMYMAEKIKSAEILPLAYMNSGDADSGDTARVVGYWAAALYDRGEAPVNKTGLSEDERKLLLALARSSIHEFLLTGKLPPAGEAAGSAALSAHCGAFVTLHKNGKLRGCIGRFTSDKALWMVVQEMAVAAATADTRFKAVTAEEMKEIDIEISVLSPLKKIESVNEIILGTHGIYISSGNRLGTFLPQVATETGWSLEEFLGHCSRDKAGLGWDGWKTADVFIYTAEIFGEKNH